MIIQNDFKTDSFVSLVWEFPELLYDISTNYITTKFEIFKLKMIGEFLIVTLILFICLLHDLLFCSLISAKLIY